MQEPKYAIGQTVYLLPTVNRTLLVSDRLWDADLKPEAGYRYKVSGSPAWFPESELKSLEEMPEYLHARKGDSDPSDHWVYSDDILDGFQDI